MSELVPIPKSFKFLLGGTSGMLATCVTQPLDLIKTRMQVSKPTVGARPSTLSVIGGVIRNEGFIKLYSGLSASLLRQATYTTTRLGIYSSLYATFSNKGERPGLLTDLAIGMTAGGLGALVGTPADVVLVRMTMDGSLPVDQRRNYSGVFNAFSRIHKEGGVRKLWKGATPTVARAMVLNAAQLTTYNQAKFKILESGLVRDGIPCYLLASMCSGLVCSASVMPLDMAKTRLQSMKTVNGVPQYKGIADVIVNVVRKEGPFALYKGFTPCYMRLGPHTVLTMTILEELNKAYKRHFLA